MSNNKITIEKEIRFSQSCMWGDQKKYYDEKGIDAWEDDVPFYITSNPFIGKNYAQLAIAFMQDWIRNHPAKKDEPFVILELGTGTGQFSFYFLKALVEYRQTLHLDAIKIRYVMSDITSRSFSFWQSHPALKSFIDDGMLEFAEFDFYHPNQSVLKSAHPPILIANYLFDSIGTDVFSVKNGQLYESLVTLTADEKEVIQGKPTQWDKVTIAYHEKPIHGSYYGDPFDSVLFSYQEKLMDTHFQFPIATLTGLHAVQSVSQHGFLLLTSDKGYTNLQELDHCDYPELDFHGSFSVMVNYHAIAEFLKQSQGDYQIQSFRDNIVTGVFSSGFTLENMPILSSAISQVIRGFSPTDYFLIYEHFIEHYQSCSIEVMSAYLNLSGWDPNLFSHISEHFCELSSDADEEIIAYLSDHMHLIADHFYYLPSCDDVLFDIALFFQNVGRFEEAIRYYALSQHYFGDSDVTFFNLAMCYYSLARYSKAMEYLTQAQLLNKDAKDVQEWIEIVKKDMNEK